MFNIMFNTRVDPLFPTAGFSSNQGEKKRNGSVQEKNMLFRIIPTITFQNNYVRLYINLINLGKGRHTIHLLKCLLLFSNS